MSALHLRPLPGGSDEHLLVGVSVPVLSSGRDLDLRRGEVKS